MATHSSRRRFLEATAIGGTLAGMGELGFLTQLKPVSAKDANVDSKMVRFVPEIEPLVRVIEDTAREKLFETIAAKIKAGTTYAEVVAALFLAGIRNVQPRPSVGFKFHAVLVVNSAHLAAQRSPDGDRWLPIFWALDTFKSSQAADEKEGNWTMSPVDDSAVPSADKARDAFIAAMDRWDEGAADVAVAGLARTHALGEIFELFYRYGARDFRSIGHKAIYVANSERLLQFIGPRHAEPVLRSLAYALLNREGSENPAESDLDADRPGRRNKELAGKLRADWFAGKIDDSATRDMLLALRSSKTNDACDLALEMLNRGVGPQAIWDALFTGAGELLMRQPGIVALHAVTSTNALRYAFDSAATDETRRQILLQNVAFVTLFRDRVLSRGKVPEAKIEDLNEIEFEQKDAGAVDEIFAAVSRDRGAAAGKVLQYLNHQGDPKALIDAAQRLVFLKGRDSHDYKFSSAVLEDYYHVSPAWRNRFLASAVYNLPGSGAQDNGLVGRAREALKSV